MPNPLQSSTSNVIWLRLLREPMIHFVVIGLVIFGVHALVSKPSAPDPDDRDRIVVTQGRVRQLAQIFVKTWHRPPTPAELRGLIDAFVKEEVYYREGVKLGLDRDDTVIRRRMQQKMEFLMEPDDSTLQATDADLRVYLEAHRDQFRVQPEFAFQQVFINPDSDGSAATVRAKRVLVRLQNLPAGADPDALGDQAWLPRQLALTTVDGIARAFGRKFAKALAGLPRNRWAGPVASSFGLHLVRITDYKKGFDPKLADIRAAVERKWREAQHDAYVKSEYKRLKAKYTVVLPSQIKVAAAE